MLPVVPASHARGPPSQTPPPATASVYLWQPGPGARADRLPLLTRPALHAGGLRLCVALQGRAGTATAPAVLFRPLYPRPPPATKGQLATWTICPVPKFYTVAAQRPCGVQSANQVPTPSPYKAVRRRDGDSFWAIPAATAASGGSRPAPKVPSRFRPSKLNAKLRQQIRLPLLRPLHPKYQN